MSPKRAERQALPAAAEVEDAGESEEDEEEMEQTRPRVVLAPARILPELDDTDLMVMEGDEEKVVPFVSAKVEGKARAVHQHTGSKNGGSSTSSSRRRKSREDEETEELEKDERSQKVSCVGRFDFKRRYALTHSCWLCFVQEQEREEKFELDPKNIITAALCTGGGGAFVHAHAAPRHSAAARAAAAMDLSPPSPSAAVDGGFKRFRKNQPPKTIATEIVPFLSPQASARATKEEWERAEREEQEERRRQKELFDSKQKAVKAKVSPKPKKQRATLKSKTVALPDEDAPPAKKRKKPAAAAAAKKRSRAKASRSEDDDIEWDPEPRDRKKKKFYSNF